MYSVLFGLRRDRFRAVFFYERFALGQSDLFTRHARARPFLEEMLSASVPCMASAAASAGCSTELYQQIAREHFLGNAYMFWILCNFWSAGEKTKK